MRKLPIQTCDNNFAKEQNFKKKILMNARLDQESRYDLEARIKPNRGTNGNLNSNPNLNPYLLSYSGICAARREHDSTTLNPNQAGAALNCNTADVTSDVIIICYLTYVYCRSVCILTFTWISARFSDRLCSSSRFSWVIWLAWHLF